MAISIKHATTAVGTEAGDGEIGKTEWNEAHTLTLETGKLLGRTTAGAGAVEEVPLLDEDDMASDSDTAVPTQQSVKAYVAAEIAAAPVGSTGLFEYVVFTTSAAFNKASYTDAKQFEVIAIGVGGDGGSGNEAGGGGGAGGVALKTFVPSDLASSVTITIDATKSEFAHSTPLVGNAGSDGSSPDGGAGGTASGGTFNITGAAGNSSGSPTGISTNGEGCGGQGGSTWMGWGIGGGGGSGAISSGGNTATAGSNGVGYGGGGGGGGAKTSGTDASGGSGAPGAIIVKVYY